MKLNKYAVLIFARTAMILVTIVICSLSFAWFSAQNTNVTAKNATFYAEQAEELTVEGGNSFSLRGNYNGETGLGEDSTRDAPFFISKQLVIPVIFSEKTKAGVGRPYTDIESLWLNLGENEPTLKLKSVTISQNGNKLVEVNQSSEDKSALDNFAWRVALVKQPSNSRNGGSTIANPSFTAPETFSWSTTNSSLIKDLYRNPSNSLNKNTAYFTFEIRIYFIGKTELAKSPSARTPFEYSGYDKTLDRYIDMTYCGASFQFDFTMTEKHGCEASIGGGIGGGS
jgi:hypothetical protein